jgi:hypothetical protein
MANTCFHSRKKAHRPVARQYNFELGGLVGRDVSNLRRRLADFGALAVCRAATGGDQTARRCGAGGDGGRTAVRRMKAAPFVSIALLLAACAPSGEQEMETCRVEAQRIHPAESSPHSNILDEYVKGCMAAKGYKFNAVSYNCGHGDAYEDSACYAR